MDLERRRHGYISDEQTISSSMSYGGLLTGGKKPKPVPPRKPSFLYLNRASSLQSVNGVVKTNSMDRSSNKIDPKGKHLEAESWNNNTAPKTSLKTLSGNLKWNILSSSRTKNAGSSRDREPREWCPAQRTSYCLRVSEHTFYYWMYCTKMSCPDTRFWRIIFVLLKVEQ